jgi:hypothetical protein
MRLKYSEFFKYAQEKAKNFHFKKENIFSDAEKPPL